MSFVYVYADESCLGNQFQDRASPGGAAGVVQVWRDGWLRRDYWVSEPATTNNRMAIRSAIEALRGLKPSRVIFVSDSQYLVKGMNEWVPAWMRRDWRRATGAVENVELWKELVQAAARHEVEWRWVRGHAGTVMNEFANACAVRAAREQTRSDGLVASRFEEWLAAQRAKARYLEFDENAPPPEEHFRPAPKPVPGNSTPEAPPA